MRFGMLLANGELHILEACLEEEGTFKSVVMKMPSKAGHLDPAVICRSSDPMAVRELLTKIAVPGISQRMLSSTLKNLERDGLIVRELFPEVPPRVEYEITDLGKSLLRPTQGLVDWAKANWEQVREAQSKYDAR